MIFLTYNDVYSGIYQSQVIDVCKTLQQLSGKRVRLVALVSLRHFNEQRRLIKQAFPAARILPMVPGVNRWRANLPLLTLAGGFSKGEPVWARGPFACKLAIALRQKGKASSTIFDARGAYEAEFNEYNLVGDSPLKTEIGAIEKNALTESDRQLAVSEKLVAWWKSRYIFSPLLLVVIPCTLAENFEHPLPSKEEILRLRARAGFSEADIVLVYSGSSAGWQSFTLFDKLIFRHMSCNPAIKLIFLSKDPPHNSQTFTAFHDRIRVNWVQPGQVRDLLLAADYGLLVREPSVTNEVASPVKFAEYLSCGLDVIISEGIGDFSDFVKRHACGLTPASAIPLQPLTYQKKLANHCLALQHFSKKSPAIRKQYERLLEA